MRTGLSTRKASSAAVNACSSFAPNVTDRGELIGKTVKYHQVSRLSSKVTTLRRKRSW